MTTILFNKEHFAKDLKEFRGERSQSEISEILGVNRSTLSLLENSKLTPSLEVIRAFCESSESNIEKYFNKQDQDPVLLMMGKIKESDKYLLENVIERINIREKYISIHRRCQK